MKLVSIPVKVALEARSINSLENDCCICNTMSPNYYFKTHVTTIKQELRKKKHCYCYNEEELEAVRKKYPNLHERKPAIYNGEEFDYLWEVWL